MHLKLKMGQARLLPWSHAQPGAQKPGQRLAHNRLSCPEEKWCSVTKRRGNGDDAEKHTYTAQSAQPSALHTEGWTRPSSASQKGFVSLANSPAFLPSLEPHLQCPSLNARPTCSACMSECAPHTPPSIIYHSPPLRYLLIPTYLRISSLLEPGASA